MSINVKCNFCAKIISLETASIVCVPCASKLIEPTPKADNIASTPCNCVVKTTEVLGMGIIYPRKDCPIHGQFHGAHC